MIIIDPGHVYELAWLDGQPGHYEDDSKPNELIFVKREGKGYPGNTGHHPGTTIQEVLRALINRVQYLDWQIRDWRNAMIIGLLRTALFLLEDRAAQRHGRRFPVTYDSLDEIERITPCHKCLHIGCRGTCHP